MKKNNNPHAQHPFQADFLRNLPKSVELLQTKEGNNVFLIGTVHFSLKSQDDVSFVIRNTQPSVVMLELCSLRKHMLEIDEETLLRQESTLDAAKIRKIILDKGLVNGMFYVSLLQTNARITKQLGVAPGGECRRAVHECKKLQNCRVILGDRPLDITLQRALKPLTFTEKLQLSNIFNDPSVEEVTAADLESYKRRDIDQLQSLRTYFPSVYRSFVTERDQILAHNLWLSSKIGGNIVGVVGMGHMNGICANFGKTNSNHIMEIMKKDYTSRAAGVNIFGKLSKLLKFLKYK